MQDYIEILEAQYSFAKNWQHGQPQLPRRPLIHHNA
jgi:hypothetical protein